MNVDTRELLLLKSDLTGNWEWDGWVILKVPGFAKYASGLFHGQSFYLYNLWQTVQDLAGNGIGSNQLINLLDQMRDMWGLETCLFE